MAEPALKVIEGGKVSRRGPIPGNPEGTIQAEMDVPDKIKMPTAVRKDPTMRTIWKKIVDPLERAGLLTEADVPALEMATRHYRAAVKASDKLDEIGVLVPGRAGDEVKNPADVVFRGESEMFMKYAVQFGLTIGARLRMQKPEEANDGDSNPFAD